MNESTTKDLKTETTSTINEVKETMKSVNLKEDTEKAKGMLLEFLKSPVEKIKEIAASGKTFFKTAIVLLILWTAAVFLEDLFYILGYSSFSSFFRYGFFDSLLLLVKAAIAPALSIAAVSFVIFTMSKSEDKSLPAVITMATFANTPAILAAFLGLLTIIGSDISRIVNPVTNFCYVISAILLFFGMQEYFKDQDQNSYFKTFMIVEAIYFGAAFILSFLGIHLI